MNFSCKSGEHRLFLRPQKVQQTKQNAFWAKRGLGTTADPTGVTLLLQVCCLALCRYCLLQSHWSQNMAGSWEWHSYIMDLSASVFKQDVIAFHALLQATLLLFASGAGEEKGVCWVQVNSRGNSCESLSNKGDLVIWQIWIEERDFSQFLKLVIVMTKVSLVKERATLAPYSSNSNLQLLNMLGIRVPLCLAHSERFQ